MRRSMGMALALMAAGLLVTQAEAFGTVRALGQDAEHERITRQGLASFEIGEKTLDEIAGSRGAFGAVGAPDRPNRGLMSSKAAHCDGGDWLDRPNYPQGKLQAQGILESCRSYIFARLEAAVQRAGEIAPGGLIDPKQVRLDCDFDGKRTTAKCDTLGEIGQALHAAQDFYSHSNWVDPPRGPGSVANPPGLGNAAPAPWLDPKVRASFPLGLISGCYDGFPETMYCKGRIAHATLNKDTAGAPRGKGGIYQLAMRVAAQDTAAKWDWFERRLIEVYGSARAGKILCAILADDPKHC